MGAAMSVLMILAPGSLGPCVVCGTEVRVRSAIVSAQVRCEECIVRPVHNGRVCYTEQDMARLRRFVQQEPERAREYMRARNWFMHEGDPTLLLDYAKKWNARLRLMPELERAAASWAAKHVS